MWPIEFFQMLWLLCLGDFKSFPAVKYFFLILKNVEVVNSDVRHFVLLTGSKLTTQNILLKNISLGNQTDTKKFVMDRSYALNLAHTVNFKLFWSYNSKQLRYCLKCSNFRETRSFSLLHSLSKNNSYKLRCPILLDTLFFSQISTIFIRSI